MTAAAKKKVLESIPTKRSRNAPKTVTESTGKEERPLKKV